MGVPRDDQSARKRPALQQISDRICLSRLKTGNHARDCYRDQ
jgi:hypothetical protein